MSRLLVGGANDGKWLALPDLPVVEVIQPREDRGPGSYPDSHMDTVCKTELYRAEKIQVNRTTFHFWASDALSTEQAIEKLLQNYRP